MAKSEREPVHPKEYRGLGRRPHKNKLSRWERWVTFPTEWLDDPKHHPMPKKPVAKQAPPS